MAASRDELINTLDATSDELARLTAGADDAALDFKPNPGDWSSREILAHLVDDEMYVMRTRMERIIKEDLPHLAPHDEKKWYANRNTSHDALNLLLSDFATQRAASLAMLRMLRDSDWQREGIQPEYGQFTASSWLGNWVEHDQVHLRQIEANLAAFRNGASAQS